MTQPLSGWRKTAGDIALLTVLLQIFAPLMLSGLGAAMGSARAEATPFSITAICTTNGIIYLQSDDGERQSIPVSADCPFCQLHHLSSAHLPSEPITFVALVARPQVRPSASQDETHPYPWGVTGIATRAPPL